MKYDCLIIDDEKELADNTCEYFNMFDVKTAAVYSKAEAETFLKDNEPRLVLLDINLSDGSGFELCKKIRETLSIPILFISARNTDDDKIIALNIGGDDYIEKPYSLGVLLAKVKVVLKRFAVNDTAVSVNSDFDDGYLKTDSVNKTVYVNGEEMIILSTDSAPRGVSVQFSRSVVSNSLRPHELQHTRPPCPLPTPGVYSNSCASSR